MCSIDFVKRLDNRRPVFFYPASVILSCGSGDRALQECNRARNRPWIAVICIPPVGQTPGPGVCILGWPRSHGQSGKTHVLRPSGRILDGLPTNSATDPPFKVVQTTVLRGTRPLQRQDRPCWRCSLVALPWEFDFPSPELSQLILTLLPDALSTRTRRSLSRCSTVSHRLPLDAFTYAEGSAWLRAYLFRGSSDSSFYSPGAAW